MGSMAKSLSRKVLRTLATLAFCLTLGQAWAQDGETYETDPPDRAARLSYLEGDVSLQPAGEEAWAPAILNRPLTTGDELWTESGARAEIQVGPATVRLNGGTGFSFLNVDDDTIQMRMAEGVINVRVRELAENDHIEIDTPNVALSLLRPGSYRVEVNGAGDTTVLKVLEGEAEASGPSHEVLVRNQQVATFRGDNPLDAQYSRLGGPDEFDSWSLERDRRDDRLASSQTSEYVSPDVTGYQDLDDNGSWSSEPEYGYVWTPRHVVAGWAPYQYGRWAWISPWGWTWIDDAPWGYAPFHYGRWANVRNRWCWVPGPRHAVRAVYAPALVGWVGSPGRLNAPHGDHGVGWFPLAPREVYVPARRYSPRYVERVNITNTVVRGSFNDFYRTYASVNYRNRAVPGAVTAVPRSAFTSSERVGNRRVTINQWDATRAQVTATPQVEPVRESRLGGASRTYVRPPPRPVAERQVIVKREPPRADAHYVRTPRVAVERPTPPQVPAETSRGNHPAVEIERRLRQKEEQEQQARNQQAWRETQLQQRRQQEDAQRDSRRQQEESQRQQWQQQQAARDQQREMQERVHQQVERHQRQEVERRAAPQQPPRQEQRQEHKPDPPRTEQRSSEPKSQAVKEYLERGKRKND